MEAEVQRLVRASVYIWNSGNQPITRADLETRAPLSLVLPKSDFTPLQISVGDQTRDANNASVVDGRVAFDYLNQADGFVVDVFADASEDKYNLLDASPINLEGEIIGARRDPFYVPYQFSSSRKQAMAFFVLGLIAGGASLAAGNNWFSPYIVPPFVTPIASASKTISFGLAILFGALAVVSLLAAILASFLAIRRFQGNF
jgi:hypothetical protein